jgi:soluble lytic murein transglycosylase
MTKKWGAPLGFVLAILATPVLRAADKSEKADPAPVEVPKAEVLAQELGYQPKVFAKAVDDFALALSQGSKSQALRRLCAKDEQTCSLVSDFQAQHADGKKNRMAARRRRGRIRVSENNVAQAQSTEFRTLLASLSLDKESKFLSLAEKSLGTSTCPRNLSAALSIEAEDLFPSPAVRAMAKDLFYHAKHCLTEDNPIFERLYLRQGLYAIYYGQKDKAKDLLTEAKKAKSVSERYRVLYWLGRLAHESGVSAEKNKDWADLMDEYPLSYYAIEAAVALKQDPLEMIRGRKFGAMKREVADDPELTRMIRWLEALYVHKKGSAVAKWASWIVRTNEENLDVGVLHYLSTLKLAAGMYRSNISMLFSYFRKNPQALNEEGLRLLYPRPYFSLIQQASRGKVDAFLVLGLVRQESAFDPRAVSRAKAKGLMQIIPQTARRLASQGHRKLLNEKENTKMGVKYLVQLGNKFDGSAELVLAAYNAGPHKVDEWLRRNPDRKENPLLWNDLIPYMETRDYVVSILRNNYLYTRLYGEPDGAPSNIFSSSLVRELVSEANTK